MGSYIGYDLDSSLASDHRGGEWVQTMEEIGDPIPKSVARVKSYLEAGYEVRIVTARANTLEQTAKQRMKQIKLIEEWCLIHIGQKLKVQAEKTYGMLLLYDDRAIQLEPNTGELITDVVH